ncbi:MAG: tetratricopeptide repeat protein [Verrucomicrobiia bacterium]
MRKIFLALLIGSLCAMQSKLIAEEMIQAANVNSEPARQAAPQPTTAPPEQTAAPAQRPADPPANPRAATGPIASPPSSEIEKASREEIVRRQEAQMMAQQLIEQGLKLYYDAKYEAAIAQLEQVIKILPRAKATETDYNRAAHGLTDSYYRLADAAYRAGDNTKAKQLAQKALEYDPHNRSAENVIVKAKAAEKREEEAAKHPPQPPSPTTVETTPAPDRAPEFLANKDEIKKLFRESKILLNSGQYDEAEKRVRQILLIDRYNDDAYTMLQRIDDARLELADNASDKTRSLRLWQVTDSWVPKIGSEVKPPALGAGGVIGASIMKKAQITKKLDEIIFPEISFREAVISDVVNFLSDESRKLDPEKVGVSIVLQAGIGGAPAPTPSPVSTPAPVESAPGVTPVTPTTPVATAGRPGGITLNLRNVPMIDALRYVTTMANLKYRIESSAVLVLPVDAPEPQMETRSYHVNPGVFGTRAMPVSALATGGLSSATFGGQQQQQQTRAGGGAGGGGQFLGLETTQIGILTVPTTDEVRTFFTSAGVQFPTNSTLVYNQPTSTIITRNTLEMLDAFEWVLDKLNTIPSQVEIEAKFVEVSQSDLNELGFQWNVAGKQLGDFAVAGGPPTTPFGLASGPPSATANNITAGVRDETAIQGNAIDSLLAAQGFGTVTTPQSQIATIRGILTNPQFELIIKALSQKKGADLLSAPKVTTVSGQQAQVRIAQEFIYPTAYTPPTAVAGTAGSVGGASPIAVTPSIPSTFSSREVGVLLNVIPTVGADGYTINLSLIPQVTEFLGFIEYGGNEALASGTTVVNVFNSIKQPLFSTRALATSIVIWDGQTVVLGGLIREDVQTINDKVPFLGDIPMLGRLFQNKTTQKTKRNLLIFVSARLIDPAGNPVHRQETAALR